MAFQYIKLGLILDFIRSQLLRRRNLCSIYLVPHRDLPCYNVDFGKRRRCSSRILAVQNPNHDTQADGTSPKPKDIKTKIRPATTSPPTFEQA